MVKQFTLVCALILAFAVGSTEATAAEQSPEEWLAARATANREWLAKVPDYESRLYDRVMIVGRRVITTGNIVIAVMIGLFLISPFWIRFILNRGGIAVSGQIAGGAFPSGISADAARRIRSLQEHQAVLVNLLANVEAHLNEREKRLQSIERDSSSLGELVSECRQMLAGLDEDIDGLTRGPGKDQT